MDCDEQPCFHIVKVQDVACLITLLLGFRSSRSPAVEIQRYQNVPVLTDLTAAEERHMIAQLCSDVN